MLARRWEDEQPIPPISLSFLAPAYSSPLVHLSPCNTHMNTNLLVALNVLPYSSGYQRRLLQLILFSISSQRCLQEARGPSQGRVPTTAWPPITAARRMRSGSLRSVLLSYPFLLDIMNEPLSLSCCLLGVGSKVRQHNPSPFGLIPNNIFWLNVQFVFVNKLVTINCREKPMIHQH